MSKFVKSFTDVTHPVKQSTKNLSEASLEEVGQHLIQVVKENKIIVIIGVVLVLLIKFL